MDLLTNLWKLPRGIERKDGANGALTWKAKYGSIVATAFDLIATDGMNEKVHVLRRKPLEYIYSFGSGGRMAGQFYGTHSIETDAAGNIYTTETYEGKRVQKFRYVGMGNPSGDVGVPRPE